MNNDDLYEIIIQKILENRCSGWNYDCCTPTNPCLDGQGDCDRNEDCVGNLICGVDNCGPSFSSIENCCFDPMNGKYKC